MRKARTALPLAAALLATGTPATSASADEETCGQELAAAAEVPEGWSALMKHVATNLDAHAVWVGSASPAAKREQAAMRKVAREYRAMADAGTRAAAAMRSMKDLPPAPHDPTKLDRPAQAKWMREKIRMQRAFAALIARHADESEKALATLDGPGQR